MATPEEITREKTEFLENHPNYRDAIAAVDLAEIRDRNGIITHNLKESWTAKELLEADFPELDWIVDGIIPVGLSVLAGRPKVGKSWLALQIANAVGSGGELLGMKVKQGKVLYLALEDSPLRLKNRIQKQGVTPATAGLITFKTGYPKENEGFEQLQLDVMTGQYRIIVIDTISRFMGKVDQMDLTEMTDISSRLQSLAINYDTAILLLDHHKKSNGFNSDVVDDVMGSTGKSAAYDTIIGLYKERGARTATLKADGRDLENYIDLTLDWNSINCTWQNVGESGVILENNNRAKVLEAIGTLTKLGDLATTKEIADLAEMKQSHVSRALGELLDIKKVIKLPKAGRLQPYALAEVC